MEKQAVRWSLTVSKDTDLSLRTFLGTQGMKKGDLSKFVEDAVKPGSGRTPSALKARPSQPLLSSNSMRAAGRPGYDSADPQVLAQHTQWPTAMGVDAVLADLTNGVNGPSWPTGTSSPDGILCLL